MRIASLATRPQFSRFFASEAPKVGASVVPTVSSTAVDFSDPKTAFATKSTGELFRAWCVLYGCSFGSLVKRVDSLYNASLTVLGDRITHSLIEKTLFRHFCAGVDESDIARPIKRLNEAGVGGILDYAAEAKEEDEHEVVEGKLPLKSQAQARVHSYSSEDKCEENAKIFKHAVTAVHNVSPNGFAAIKLSALGEPALMERMSQALIAIETFFATLSANAVQLSFPQFAEGWKRFFTFTSEAEIRAAFDKIDSDKDGTIDIVDWMSSLSLVDVSQLVNSCKDEGPLYRAALDAGELEMMKNLLRRCDEICGLAALLKVRVMIDAEWSAIQPAIDNTIMHMQRKYNRAKVPVVFSTYQTYLIGSQERVKRDLERAGREGWKFGAKVVRGAYMVGERERAKKLDIPSPVWGRYSETETNYHQVLEMLIADPSTELMVASHNERTMQFVLEKMNSYNKQRNQVYFGQLLGMADHLTFVLAAKNFFAYKYIPYGPVDEVVPYLIRRTQENSTLLGTPAVVEERRMLFRELRRRAFGF